MLAKLTYINGVYSKDNLPKVKNEKYVINLDDFDNNRNNWDLR